MWGLVCAVAASGGNFAYSSVEFRVRSKTASKSVTNNGQDDSAAWWSLLWIPLAVGVSMYTLLVLGKRDAGTVTAGTFSTLYIQFIAFSWDYEPSGLRNSVLSTALVRLLALLTGICAAFIVNGVTSAFLLSVLFEHQFETLHWLLGNAAEFLREDPFDKRVQSIFETLQEYIDVRNRELCALMTRRRILSRQSRS